MKKINFNATKILSFFMTGVFFVFSFQANAGVVIYGTRIIYPANNKEVSVRVENISDFPALTQVSIDAGDLTENIEESNVPFFINPPIARIEAQSGHAFRVIKTNLSGDVLPQDKETLFYFNLLEIPPLAKEDGGGSQQFVQLGMMSRLKLFYRPTGILSHVVDAPKNIKWKMDGDFLKINNQSGYYISFSDIFIKKSGGVYRLDFFTMSPMSEVGLKFDEVAKVVDSEYKDVVRGMPDDSVYFYYLNDVGAALSFQTELIKEN